MTRVWMKIRTPQVYKNLIKQWSFLHFFLICLVGGGVQLGPLDTAASDWPIVAYPGWLWWWRIWWNEDWQGKPKYSEKTRPSATLPTTNPTWQDPRSNQGRRGGKPATNRLSYVAANNATYCSGKIRPSDGARLSSFMTHSAIGSYTRKLWEMLCRL
jgi:hypothetical protein